MSIAIAIWQLIIFVSIVISGRARIWVTLFWGAWTIVQIYTLPLSVLQFATIGAAYVIGSSLRPSRSRDMSTKSGSATSVRGDRYWSVIVVLLLIAVYWIGYSSGNNPAPQLSPDRASHQEGSRKSPVETPRATVKQGLPEEGVTTVHEATPVEVLAHNRDGTCLLRPQPHVIIQGPCP